MDKHLCLIVELLRAEGLEVKDNKVVDFKTLYWDPLRDMDC